MSETDKSKNFSSDFSHQLVNRVPEILDYFMTLLKYLMKVIAKRFPVVIVFGSVFSCSVSHPFIMTLDHIFFFFFTNF